MADQLHRHRARYPGAFEVSDCGPPEVVGVTGYHFTFHPKDYPALLELLGPEEFERRVCSLDEARRVGWECSDVRSDTEDLEAPTIIQAPQRGGEAGDAFHRWPTPL